jgi:hypothetical protein
MMAAFKKPDNVSRDKKNCQNKGDKRQKGRCEKI